MASAIFTSRREPVDDRHFVDARNAGASDRLAQVKLAGDDRLGAERDGFARGVGEALDQRAASSSPLPTSAKLVRSISMVGSARSESPRRFTRTSSI